jgi:hypothetical protein
MRLNKTMVRLPVCPRCNHENTVLPALSRVDNRTEICASCGRIEALCDYYARHAKNLTLSGLTDFLNLMQPIATELEKAIWEKRG